MITSTIEYSASALQPADMRTTLRHLRQETLLFVLPVFYIAGFILLAAANSMTDPIRGGLPALLLFLWPFLVWGALRLNYWVAAWILVSGCLAINLLVVTWAQFPMAVALLMLPIGLAVLFIGTAGGMALAMLCTLWLFYTERTQVSIDPALCNVTLIGIWGVFGLILLTSHPLLTAIRWFWSSHEQSRKALDQARDHQEKLGRLVEDLADANLQLTRLNRVASAMRQAAEDARRAKEQFVANVSHELRTPLNMVIGFSEMITQTPALYGVALPTPLLADLDVILRNSHHLAHLIDDVLDMSQIEADQMALSKERVTLAEIIDAAVIAVRPLFVSKGLQLQVALPADLPLIFCDRTRIRQVLLNLLSNAGRFTEQGGVQIQVYWEGAFIAVHVADSGPGIPAVALARLFQPFEQLDDSLSRRVGGNGLGLSISKRFVELHEGKMWVKSEVGVGTTFGFRLPVDPPALAEGSFGAGWLNSEWEYRQRTRPSSAPVPVLRPRFVVLEEADALQRLLRRYLDGVEVTAVTTLAEAITALAQSPAHALLVNDVAWAQNCQPLTESIELPYGTPLLLCALPGLHEATNGLGIADYLVKPIASQTLLAALDRLHLKNRTVLLVDDEPDALHLYRRILSAAEQKYRVLRAGNGQEALDILRSQRPDVILLDLVMPKLDGFRLLAAKNQDATLRAIPAIVMTARDPVGQPIVSNALTVTQQGGLSVAQLLACITALSEILSKSGQGTDLTWLKEPAE